jgi:hypothetical protein
VVGVGEPVMQVTLPELCSGRLVALAWRWLSNPRVPPAHRAYSDALKEVHDPHYKYQSYNRHDDPGCSHSMFINPAKPA